MENKNKKRTTIKEKVLAFLGVLGWYLFYPLIFRLKKEMGIKEHYPCEGLCENNQKKIKKIV